MQLTGEEPRFRQLRQLAPNPAAPSGRERTDSAHPFSLNLCDLSSSRKSPPPATPPPLGPEAPPRPQNTDDIRLHPSCTEAGTGCPAHLYPHHTPHRTPSIHIAAQGRSRGGGGRMKEGEREGDKEERPERARAPSVCRRKSGPQLGLRSHPPGPQWSFTCQHLHRKGCALGGP